MVVYIQPFLMFDTSHSLSGVTRNRNPAFFSEWIADGQMKTQAIFERGQVVIALLAGVVGQMQTDPHIHTDHQEGEHIADSGTCAQGQVFEEPAPFQLAARTLLIASQEPDVTTIHEEGGMQIAHDRESVFQVGFELDVSRPVDVGVWILLICIAITSGADTSDGKGPDAVGSTDVELLVVGRGAGIAITVDGSCHHAAYQMRLLTNGPIITGLQGSFDELGKGIAHPVLALFAERLACHGIDAVEQQTRLRHRHLPPPVMTTGGQGGIVVGIGEAHRGDKLILQTLLQGLVHIRDAVEDGCRTLQQVEGELEGRDGEMGSGRTLELVRRFPSKGQELEEAGPVHLIGIQPEGGAGRQLGIPMDPIGEE